MSNLDTIATIQKNGVIGLNAINQRLSFIYGTNTSATVTASTLIVSGPGRLVNVAVVVAGSAVGTVYNAASTSAAAAANALVSAPNTAGVVQVGSVFSNGLVVTPGTGQSLNVTYSLGT
jgi:hypothetical protein